MTFKPEQALKRPLVLLTGEEEALRRRALNDLLGAAGIGPEDFDLATLVADAAPVGEWISSAATAPFLGERRVVVVRNVLRIDPRLVSAAKENRAARDRFVADLKSLPASALLILVADAEAASDDRQRKLASAGTALAKIVVEAGGHVAEFKPDPKAAKATITAEIARHGRKIGPAALDSLLAMTGGSASRAIEEVEKLVLFTDKDAITEGDVHAVVFASPEWSIWKLVDAVAGGNARLALAQLRTLLTAGKKPENAALEQILPMLSRQMRLLWQARVCLDIGVRPSDAPPEIARGFPEKPNLGKEPEYRQTATMTTARGYTTPQIAACLRLLSDADAALKGMVDHLSTIDTLETMVLKMCDVVRPVR